MSNPWGVWLHAFEHGASFHGNWPACVEVERALERYTGGQPCPQGCGSIVRYRVGRPREESVGQHTRNPDACRKHPQHHKRKRVRRP